MENIQKLAADFATKSDAELYMIVLPNEEADEEFAASEVLEARGHGCQFQAYVLNQLFMAAQKGCHDLESLVPAFMLTAGRIYGHPK